MSGYSTETGKFGDAPICLKRDQVATVGVTLSETTHRVDFNLVVHNGAVLVSLISNRGCEVPFYRHLGYDSAPRPLMRTICMPLAGALRFYYIRNYADTGVQLNLKGLGAQYNQDAEGVVTGQFTVSMRDEVPSSIDQLASIARAEALELRDRRR